MSTFNSSYYDGVHVSFLRISTILYKSKFIKAYWILSELAMLFDLYVTETLNT
jgi:hypothetical protein